MRLLTAQQPKEKAVSDDIFNHTERLHGQRQGAHHDSITSDENKGDHQGHLPPWHAAANQRAHKGANHDEYRQ